MATPRRVFGDYRANAEQSLAARKALIAAEQGQGHTVIGPYYPREPLNAGDEASPSGTRIAYSELDDDMKARVDTVSGASDYVGRFEGAGIGTGDIPLDKWGWWYDTTNGRLLVVRNRAGVLYGVEAENL